MTGQLDQAAKGQPGDSCLSTDELFLRAAHTYNQALTSDLPEGYCRNFPAYTEQTQAFLAWDTLDAALCDTALLFLTSFVALLKQLTQAAEDFSFLLSATLVGENGRPPRTEHGQRSAELLADLAEQGDSIYRKYHSLEDNVHIQTRHKRPAGNKKGGISAATFYASGYTARVTLFGICTDVFPGSASCRL